jgi:glycosyltransferase involved in cell wall biosynthesis
MTALPVYYLDGGIVNNVGHNLETIEFLKETLGPDIDFTLIAGKRFAGHVEGLRILPLLHYGSPHWPVPSRYMNAVLALARRSRLAFFDDLAQRLKAYELKRDLSSLSPAENSCIIINSVELDDAYFQCEALWAQNPRLKIKVILHYSPFTAAGTLMRSKLKKPIAAIQKIHRDDIRLSFYADTDKLCQVYAALLNRPVTLLPIPHAKRGENSRGAEAKPPYQIIYFGTYSEAKAPHLIPEIIRLTSATASFEWSVYITYIVKNRVIAAFERALRALEAKTGRPIYHVGPFTTQHINTMFSESDIILIPYHSHDYEIQSSGVVMEALVSGKIPLLSRSMADAAMLEAVDPYLVFRPNNEMDMVASLKYVAHNYQILQEKLAPLRQKMEAFHNPHSFIKTLLG